MAIDFSRDIGQAIGSVFKPDGSIASALPSISSLSQGIVSNITGLNPGRATDFLSKGVSSLIGSPLKPLTSKSGANLTNILYNPLENFASYDCLWTLSTLTREQFNNPSSYRNSLGDLKHVIFSSGGRLDSARAQIVGGAPEYYVNNFVMNTYVAPNAQSGNSNAIKFSFEIYEPTSMGLLLQSMQRAALDAGYINYLNDCPFVLRLDIQGYNELGQVLSNNGGDNKIVPKFFTMKFSKVQFSVNEGGSTYKCEGVPYNHIAFSDNVNILYKDTSLNGSTVIEVLKTGENSLENFLNKNEEELLKQGKIGIKDKYTIQFPEKASDFLNNASVPGLSRASASPNALDAVRNVIGSSAQVNLDFTQNDIGQSSFGFDATSGGSFSPLKGDIRDEKTGIVKREAMTIDPKSRNFKFAQEQKLTHIINQIILSSKYAKDAIDPKNTVNGFIKWWRLDMQIQLIEYDPQCGDYAMEFIIRVVPFLVHQSIFDNPTSVPPGYAELEKLIVKQYNYIYTGQNVDVLKYDIEINNLVYTGVNPSNEANSAKQVDQSSNGVGENPPTLTKTPINAADAGAETASMGRKRVKVSPDTMDKFKGGSGATVSSQEIAESFHKALVQGGTDLIRVNLEIVGDPYWIIDSGISNYIARESPRSRLLTDDGTMNYEGGDVYVYLTFRTPIDINETTGLYDFPPESPFSGIYRVIGCENTFADGAWKQKLKCVRMPGQSSDFANNQQVAADLAVDKAKAAATELTKKAAPETTPAQDTDAAGPGDVEQTGT